MAARAPREPALHGERPTPHPYLTPARKGAQDRSAISAGDSDDREITGCPPRPTLTQEGTHPQLYALSHWAPVGETLWNVESENSVKTGLAKPSEISFTKPTQQGRYRISPMAGEPPE